MSRTRSSQRDARLRDLLQQGDPAAGEPGLSTEEVQTMRRTVLTAVPEERRRLGFPVFAMGTAMALALLLAVVLWRGGEDRGVRPPEEKVAAATPAEPVRPPALPVEPVVKEPVRKPPAAPRVAPPRRSPEPEPAVTLASVPEPSLPEAGPEEPRTRHIEFSTPGGTRVIWVLTEDETLLK